MGYEESEPYVVNDEGGEYIAQTPTEESARKHLIEYFTHQDARLDHIGTGNNATIDLTIAVAEFDLEHPDLYKLHPTAEWSRIQQALKERDELAAELERLPKTKDGKAIFLGDEVWFHDPDRSVFDPEGIVCEEVCSIYNGKGFEEYEGDFTICCDTYEAGNLEFYSSREACSKEVQEEQDQLIEGAEQEANRIRKDGE